MILIYPGAQGMLGKALLIFLLCEEILAFFPAKLFQNDGKNVQ